MFSLLQTDYMPQGERSFPLPLPTLSHHRLSQKCQRRTFKDWVSVGPFTSPIRCLSWIPSPYPQKEGNLVFQAGISEQKIQSRWLDTASLVWSQALLSLLRICLVLDWSSLKAHPHLGVQSQSSCEIGLSEDAQSHWI